MVLQSADYVALHSVKELLLFGQFLNAFVCFTGWHFDDVANKLAVGHRPHNFTVQFLQCIADFIFV
ncbi:MAG: hypothetical protein JST44_08450 [Cyanobacteria bacterium SZAS LIN-5]|nr:hypothetical protein [Cyanobacteria bacterium SZAS LIN-5]